jgi:hypothetical protein
LGIKGLSRKWKQRLSHHSIGKSRSKKVENRKYLERAIRIRGRA